MKTQKPKNNVPATVCAAIPFTSILGVDNLIINFDPKIPSSKKIISWIIFALKIGLLITYIYLLATYSRSSGEEISKSLQCENLSDLQNTMKNSDNCTKPESFQTRTCNAYFSFFTVDFKEWYKKKYGNDDIPYSSFAQLCKEYNKKDIKKETANIHGIIAGIIAIVLFILYVFSIVFAATTKRK